MVFAAIAGVPPDLVSAETLTTVDFADSKARDAFYDTILQDPRMQTEIDPTTNPGMGTGNLKPSCARKDVNGELATATPPRRIVELAKLFGENGIVQSICQDDFEPAIRAIAGVIGRRLELHAPKPP